MESNLILTPSIITREALRILHEKTTFCQSVTRSYDSKFAKDGAKIGDTLDIRLPVQYEVGEGADITNSINDTEQRKTQLKVDTRKHVALGFTMQELTLDLDSFSELHLKPAVSKLASSIEADIISRAVVTIPNISQVLNFGFDAVNKAREALELALVPPEGRRLLLTPSHATSFLTETKGLFQSSNNISKQYREGLLGKTLGFNVSTSSYLPRFASGSAAAATGYAVSVDYQPNEELTSLTVTGGSGTLLVGDIITIDGVYDVHPETKAERANLKTFSVTEDFDGSTALSVYPALAAEGAYKTVSALPLNGAVINKLFEASEVKDLSIAYHKSAFAFVTADLKMPRKTEMSHREQYEGFSLRLVRDYQIYKDTDITRLDVLYGFAPLYPHQATLLV